MLSTLVQEGMGDDMSNFDLLTYWEIKYNVYYIFISRLGQPEYEDEVFSSF
jgi:hypothetical protein